ncbi:DUF2934 domain-containing protein [Microvirga lenta]|uniref:DUF2934 domain-containing protein n=1 Tax=Microvirga lenta TaxID=2881337 RepID=UPI001CFFAB7B|nr:DUF2934 domain-containing protein [Microvirga lenta]MCB5175907.1 DUF2934 domain-containing protein [Microvirga lenta]
MTQEKTGPDATPRIGLDLGRQVLEGPGGGGREENAGASEEMIRQKAYEIWEREGRTGDPQDHWYRAERELSDAAQERTAATVEDAPPVAAVSAKEAVSDQPAEEATKRKRTQRKG